MPEDPHVTVFSTVDGPIPPIRLPEVRRVDRLTGIRPDDGVVLLYGDVLSPLVRRTTTLLGPAAPPILALATRLDADDVLEAVYAGAVSYLQEGPVPGSVWGAHAEQACLTDALRRTARGEHCFTFEAAAFLVQRVRSDRADGPPDRYAKLLSPRERQAMDMLVQGLTTREVALGLGTTEKTTRNYLSRIYNKLQVRRQSEAIVVWLGRTHPQETANATAAQAS